MQLTEQHRREIVREEIKAALEERAAAATTAFTPVVEIQNFSRENLLGLLSHINCSKRNSYDLICK